MNRVLSLILLAVFLFVSGFCSLAYQVVWLREFRLVFGGATPAASAVLAVFMGALGLGGWYLGKKLDLTRFPGRWYAKIEGFIAISVLVSPALLSVTKALYYSTGGTQGLGMPLAIALQVLLTVVVLGVPCFFMGGTLPAAINYAQDSEDVERKATAFLYGINILGAVTGAFLVNFYALEIFGNQFTLIASGVLNLLLAGSAYMLIARQEHPRTSVDEEFQAEKLRSRYLIYGMAFLSGLIFFVSEIIWFRTSIPLLGGSVFNFGLILVIALTGMSLGGVAYSVLLKFVKPSFGLLALVSGLFACALILPYAMGDGFARFCLVLQSGYINYPFDAKLWTWFVIGGVLLFPASFMAGVQFPLFLSLIGTGNENVSEQVGKVYAFNTAGAVLGSLAGGFIFIPYFSIAGTWVAMAWLTLAAALVLAIYSLKRNRKVTGSFVGACAVLLLTGCMIVGGSGLTSYWQHNPIGFGRLSIKVQQFANDAENEKRYQKRTMIHYFDGRELTAGLMVGTDLALLSNGKSDGSALGDAPTQVMLTLIGAILHDDIPKKSCVVGLGTGTSAGWLAEVPGVERVDVLELEEGIIESASYYKAVNFDVVNHPKVNLLIGDAREFLSVERDEKYDFVASEPSNPQRAGVANLYTKEFYQSVSSNMTEDGIFCQWLQAYEIDAKSVVLILSTLRSVYPHVEIFQTLTGDLVFVAKKKAGQWNLESVREKLTIYPFADAMRYTWGVKSAEAFFAHAVANVDRVDELVAQYPYVNTDNKNSLEFELGRTGGRSSSYLVTTELFNDASKAGKVMPHLTGELDKEVLGRDLPAVLKSLGRGVDMLEGDTWGSLEQIRSRNAELDSFDASLRANPEYSFQPANTFEAFMWVGSLVQAGDERGLQQVENFKENWPVNYHCFRSIYYRQKGEREAEIREMLAMMRSLKQQAWCRRDPVASRLSAFRAELDVDAEPYPLELRKEMFAELGEPFLAHLFEENRKGLRWSLANGLDSESKLKAVLGYEPYFPFVQEMLKTRVEVYEQHQHPNLERAKEDLELFMSRNK